MMIVYEREKIYDNIGSQESKISFLQSYGRTAYFGKKYTQFFSAGIYQLVEGPPIIVLPWFLKDNSGFSYPESNSTPFFEFIKDIKKFVAASVDLSNEKENTSALDIILYSYLINLQEIVKSLLSQNYHHEVNEKVYFIKGRWELNKDIPFGGKPVKFTCTYNSLETNIPIFIFIKTFCRNIHSLLKSKKNLVLIDQMISMLRDVDNVNLSRNLIHEARLWCKSHKEAEKLLQIIDFAERLLMDQSVYSRGAGVSYSFEMDKFFEDLVLSFFNLDRDFAVMPQSREDVLGGATWVSSDNTSFDLESKRAKQYSVPDIVAFNSSRYIVLECKYKPLRIPFINDEDSNEDLVSFSRDDRNQLLSFIMSVRPSPEIRNKKIDFVVIFPTSYVTDYRVTELNFDSAKLHIDPLVRNLVQNRIKIGSNSLSIKFIGLNVNYLIQSVLRKDVEQVRKVIEVTRGVQGVANLERAVKFEKLVEKRVALTGAIIDESKNDYHLGRVKLAKVFYLADAHLKLGMDANYLREAAGPLDQKILYSEKWGIESQGLKNSYYRRIEKPKSSRYYPSQNISTITARAKTIFADKIENIHWLINILKPLSSEQVEIVATLYACWNDLLHVQRDPKDKDIIEDFLNNWHFAKKRYADKIDRLYKALDWMRGNDLIPDGSGPISNPKNEKIPSGF